MKPIVGINVDLKEGPPPEACLQLPYIQAVERSGGIPLLIPPMPDADLDALLPRLDGIIFGGGRDYSPSLYNQEPLATHEQIDPRREEFDFRFFQKAFRSSEVPILGVCLGCQLINISLGGSLIQDIKTCVPASTVAHASIDGWNKGFSKHSVSLQKGSYLHHVYKTESLLVSSSHHQVIDVPGDGLSVVARSDDGLIEGVELEHSRFVVGVQWHPERLYDGKCKNLFDEFIAACRSSTNRRQLIS